MNTLDTFKNEAPEVAMAFDGLIESLKNTDGLDPKTKQLIYLSLKAREADATAVTFHTQMAKQAGAARNEIRDAILITLTVCGLTGVSSCLKQALDAYDNKIS